MYNNFERIESVQLKTELRLKLNNPFGVSKSLINFDYTNMIKFLKQNICLTKDGINQENLDNYFRFITEHLFILLSNEISLQYGIVNFGQDIMIPIMINTLILSLIGKSKIEENLFHILEINCDNLTFAEEKKYTFYVMKDLVDVANNYLDRNSNYLKYGFIGAKKAGKTKLVKNLVLFDNSNNKINFYKRHFQFKNVIFVDLPSVFTFSSYVNNFVNYLDKRIFIICNNEILKNWIKFIKSKNWNRKYFFNFLKNNIEYDYNCKDIYIINKTDLIDTSPIKELSTKLLKKFIKNISDYIDINTEELNFMDEEEIYHLINFIIKCGNIDNIFWGSIENGTNLKKIIKYIEKVN